MKMSQNTDPISVHQLLHGYDGGHKLLASSRDLPPAVARKILVQSDLSGGVPTKAFETYLTGYPLREIFAYAFARTWYAPEMPRPGCVWTHTLLVEGSDIETLPSLSSLLKHFIRPQDSSYNDYRSSIQAQREAIETGVDILPTDCASFLRLFYGSEQAPVVMVGNEQQVFETLFIELWAQLWPSARLNFTFSTGSLSARKFESRPFDIQLAPPNSVREVVRASGGVLAHRDACSSVDQLGPGICALVEDFVSRGQLGLRQFLIDIADVGLTRQDAGRAALVYTLLPQHEGPTKQGSKKLLQVIAENFPSAEQANTLKLYCLSAIECFTNPEMNRWIILQLATQNYGEAFTSPTIGLNERITHLINQDSNAALDLLLTLSAQSLNRFGEQIALSIVSSLSEVQALSFLKRNPQLISTFVKVRPVLAAKSNFWAELNSHSHEILEAVSSSNNITTGQLNCVFSALFHAELDREANHFFSLFGSSAVAAMFSHRGPYPANLRDRWTDALAARADLVENFLSKTPTLTPEILAGVSSTYSPAQAANSNFPLDSWIRALSTWKPMFEPNLGSTVETCAFSLALSFRLNGAKAAELCLVSFRNAHTAAARQTMPYSAWSMLESIVPHISWINDWDRCERMRRAIIQSFDEDKWPLEYFFRILDSPELLEEFVRSAVCLPSGRRLLDRVNAAVKSGFIPAEESLTQITSMKL